MKRPKLKAKTVKLLRQIKRKILREPRQFQMRDLFTTWVPKRTIPNCGTAACIAGWAAVISWGVNPSVARRSSLSVYDAGQRALAITRPQADRLFELSEWPLQFLRHLPKGEDGEPFIYTWDTAQSPPKNAKLAARRIEYFIKTGK